MPVALLNNEGDGVEIADLEVMLLSSLIPFFSCFVFFKRSFVFEKDLNMLTCVVTISLRSQVLIAANLRFRLPFRP